MKKMSTFHTENYSLLYYIIKKAKHILHLAKGNQESDSPTNLKCSYAAGFIEHQKPITDRNKVSIQSDLFLV